MRNNKDLPLVEKVVNKILAIEKKSKLKWLAIIFLVVTIIISTSLGLFFSLDKNKTKMPIIPTTQKERDYQLLPTSLLPQLEAKNLQSYYQFDNKLFASKAALSNYARRYTTKRNFGFGVNNYLFDGQVFLTRESLNEYLANKFKIAKHQTIRHPKNYTINSSGELSRDVLTYSSEEPVRVYKGKNGSAYFDKEQALETYYNIDEVYDLNGEERYNKYEAIRYVEDALIKSLEQGNDKRECYMMGALCLIEGEIKQWLRENTKTGFEIKGRSFSDFTFSNFVEKAEFLIGKEIFNDYIRRVDGADINSYWFDFTKDTNGGYFVGPRYVETAEKIDKNLEFQEASEFTPSLFLALATLSTFADTSSYVTSMREERFDWGKFNLFDFYNDNVKTNTLTKAKFQKIKNNEFRELWRKVTKGLDWGSLSDPGLNDFHRWLIMMKRVLQNLKMYYTDDRNMASKMEKLFVQAIIDFLKEEDEFMNVLVDKSNNSRDSKNWDENFKLMSFNDIYNLYLNQNAFFVENKDKQAMLAFIENVQSFVDNVVSVGNDIANTTSKLKGIFSGKDKDNQENRNNNNNINSNNNGKEIVVTDQMIQNNRIEIHNHYYETSVTNIKTTIKSKVKNKFVVNMFNDLNKNDTATWTSKEVVKEKINITSEKHIKSSYNKQNASIKSASPLSGVGSLFNNFATVWELSNTLSFVSVKTLKYEIDSVNSIYYIVPTLKVPILNWSPFSVQPNVTSTVLTESILNYMLPDNKDGEKTEVYEFNDKYYLNYEYAKDDLISNFYEYPEKYAGSKKLYVNIMDKDETQDLSHIKKQCQNANEENCLSSHEYLAKIEEEKNKFIQKIFDLHFKSRKKNYYFDGFYNYFDDKQAAINSAKENLAKEKFKVKYRYITNNGKKITRDSKAEIVEYIKNYEVIKSKYIINSDIISNSGFDSLEEYSGIDFDVYELDFYGQKKYFMSYMQAWNYLQNHVNYQVITYDAYRRSFNFGDYEFFNENDYNNWILTNINEIEVDLNNIDKGIEIIYE